MLDGAFFAANLTKFLHGGWFPILIALVVFLFMGSIRTALVPLLRALEPEG